MASDRLLIESTLPLRALSEEAHHPEPDRSSQSAAHCGCGQARHREPAGGRPAISPNRLRELIRLGNNTFLVLGGYGGAGLSIAHFLLQETNVRLILAGRSREKAGEIAEQLNAEFRGGRVQWRYADAADVQSLTTALEGSDLLLVCSTTTRYAEQIARTALLAGLDYMDIINQEI